MMYISFPQIYFGIEQYKLEKGIFLAINSLCYNLTYYVKILEKYVQYYHG